MTCKWVDDSHHLILEHFDMISNSPSEIYCYAIPFSPSSSWLHEYYSPKALQGVEVVKGLQAAWGTCFRTVSLDHTPLALASWKNLTAVGCESGNVIILDAFTGISTSIHSSHTDWVKTVAFSPDGTLLVSGSEDKTVNLWDVQTGGVVKTFHGHTGWVFSVSVSLDCTMVASGSSDYTARLWDVQTGECCCVIEHSDIVYSVYFSPTSSQLLISASRDGAIQQWDFDGHQIGSTHKGNCIAFSSDGTHFISWGLDEGVATIWDSDSGEVVAQVKLPGGRFHRCCFSPDGKCVAGCVDQTIYIWDITNPDPHLVETFIGHSDEITSLAYTSSLISSSLDRSIKFWQTGTSPKDSVTTTLEIKPLASASIESVSLQAAAGIAISSDSAGVVKTWNILTGLFKESFQTPARGTSWRDVQLIGGRLTLVWLEDRQIHIWYPREGEQLPTLGAPYSSQQVQDFRISGDGSKIFLLDERFIQVWSIQARAAVGRVELEGKPLYDSIIVDGSRVWVHYGDLQIQGWDFDDLRINFDDIPDLEEDSEDKRLPKPPPDRPHLCFIGTRQQNTSPSRIENTVTGKEVFQLPGRHVRPNKVKWDGRYLVAGYQSGEVLVLDFIYMIPQ